MMSPLRRCQKRGKGSRWLAAATSATAREPAGDLDVVLFQRLVEELARECRQQQEQQRQQQALADERLTSVPTFCGGGTVPPE